MDVIKELESINWNFKRYRQTGIDNIHWYPANFIPQIPSILIANLSKPNSVVLDPFCGSGTTLVEAARLGRIGIGTDFNPLACLISGVKTTYIKPEILDNLPQKIENLFKHKQPPDIFAPNFPNKDRWFHQDTFNELCFIFHIINCEKIETLRNLYKVCFSAILKKCCTQRDHYTYVADNMFPKKNETLLYVNAKKEFLVLLKKAVNAIINLYRDIEIQGANPKNLLSKFIVKNEDARSLKSIENDKADLVVTSPPYANVTDYITGSRLSFYWFDIGEIQKLKKEEIGARWKRARKKALEDYINDIFKSFAQIHRVLKKDSFLCCILGESSSLKNNINLNQKIISILTEKIGFELISDCIERNIYAKRIRAVRGVTKEHIYILKK